MGTLVRDELSGEVFEAGKVRWSASLSRDNWATHQQMDACGWRHPMTDNHKPWALSTDCGEARWLPVTVLP